MDTKTDVHQRLLALQQELELERIRCKQLEAKLAACSEGYAVPLPISSSPSSSILGTVLKRTSVLVILLLFQSISSSVLTRYEDLIAHHTIIPLFLTMLVGAGGNAGNQATVRSISGLACKDYHVKDFALVIRREFTIGVISACFLSLIGYFRVFIFVPADNGLLAVYAITLSLFLIVCTSAIIGSALPFVLEALQLDREHAGPAIQVIMDILGVLITCMTTQRLLNPPV
eukprot:TRINITY_DN44685_c0_g1_i1.p1 TRINITY_DN44685_c0_g1~~TRINITY_DN44685_c0_g1_i1.p1  ORF type:complete len:230 (-),score=20.03 TRINITY_DN44685_c0_g1_i1:38-727(-)